MTIIKIDAASNGAHQNQTGKLLTVPDGWARIPDDMPIPNTFPFVILTVDGQTVTSMTAGTVPEPAPTPTQLPSTDEIIRSQNATITMMASVIQDMQSDLEALKA